MPACLDGADVRIIGFGQDYMLITFGDDCPGCVSGGGVEKLVESLKDVNVVFVTLSGSCGLDRELHKDNHLWLRDGVFVREIFPETAEDWWKTQRGQSTCPRTFNEVKGHYEALIETCRQEHLNKQLAEEAE